MARIGKTGNAKIAKKALARIRKMKSGGTAAQGKKKCRAAVKAFAEAAAHTGAALHGGEKAKGLHKQLHAAETKVTGLCSLAKATRRKFSRRRRVRGGGGPAWDDVMEAIDNRDSEVVAARAARGERLRASPSYYAPASGSGGAAFTREQFNRATGISGVRRRSRK